MKDPDSYQQCPLTGQEAMGKNKNPGNSIQTQEITFSFEGSKTLSWVTQRVCGVSILEDF